MDTEEKIKYWIDLAEYDFETAEAMFITKRYLYVGFMCHQIIEKLLKAYFVKSQQQTPPYTHNLRFLAESSGLSDYFDEETLLFIIGLQPLNIEDRYPTYKEGLLNILTEEKCKSIIKKTKEFSGWINLKL